MGHDAAFAISTVGLVFAREPGTGRFCDGSVAAFWTIAPMPSCVSLLTRSP